MPRDAKGRFTKRKTRKKPKAFITRRPAEIAGGVAGAVAWLCAELFGLPARVIGPLTMVVGAVPAGVTWLVTLVRGR